jgi:CRP/FNR family cyclic AMP-dependent transcriptional regulator
MSTKFPWLQNSPDAKPFAAGDLIFQEGAAGDFMYVVQDGQVDIVLHDKVVETVETGGILGELALVDNRPRSANAVARTDCKLVAVDQKRFTFMVQETPFFAIRVMEVMANRLRHMDELTN